MKKYIAILFLVLLIISSLYAENGITAISPSEGAFDIPLGSPYYQTRENYVATNGNTPTPILWRDINVYNSGQSGDGFFTDRHIVGIASINYSKYNSSEDLFFSIDFKTDTGSFEFVSQSNNGYSRPFKLYALLNTGNSEYPQGKVALYEIKEGMSTNRILLTNPKYSGSVWFDIILALPGGGADSSTNWTDNCILDWDGKRYFLADLDDYCAMVTATIAVTNSSGELVDSAVISYPMTGSFKKSDYQSTVSNLPGVTNNYSLLVNPYPQAYNINLNDAGKVLPVTSLDYIGEWAKNNNSKNKQPIIFLSAKENPSDASNTLFKFSHVDAGTVFSGRNSIGYLAYIVDDKGNRYEFDGSEYISTDGILKQASTNSEVTKISFPISSAKLTSTNGGYTTSWYQFKGYIQIILNEKNGLMWPGQYNSTIYVHLMSQE